MQPVRGGQMLSLGLAAVMHYLGSEPGNIIQTEEMVGVGVGGVVVRAALLVLARRLARRRVRLVGE